MSDKYFVPVKDIVMQGVTYTADTVYRITDKVIPELFDRVSEGTVQLYSKLRFKPAPEVPVKEAKVSRRRKENNL